MKRGQTDYAGILLVDKPEGLSSHDVINRCRKVFGENRIGHAGTLDPMATGLMIVLVGPAARLSNYVSAKQKSYRATVSFGTSTNTYDATGEVTAETTVPEKLIHLEFAQSYLQTLVGKHNQVPPAFSAIKREGRRAYADARQGLEVELPPRPVEFFSFENISAEANAHKITWSFDVTVSSGTYIRSLAHDIGIDLKTVSHLSALRRLTVGASSIANAYTLEALSALEDPTLAFTDPRPILGLPSVDIDAQAAKGFRVGTFPQAKDVKRLLVNQGTLALNDKLPQQLSFTSDATFVAVASLDGNRYRPEAYFEKGISLGTNE